MQARCASRSPYKTQQHSQAVVITIKLLALSTQLGKTVSHCLFPLAGVWHFGLHRRCSRTLQPARVSSSKGSKKTTSASTSKLCLSANKRPCVGCLQLTTSADAANAGQCKDELSTTSQAQDGTGCVGQVGPSALCHGLSMLFVEACKLYAPCILQDLLHRL